LQSGHQLTSRGFASGLSQELHRLSMGQGQQHRIKSTGHDGVLAMHLQLPTLRVQSVARDALDTHIEVQASGRLQRCCPVGH